MDSIDINNSYKKNYSNILLAGVIILCSITFLSIKGIGKLDRVAEIAGVGLIFIFLVLFKNYGGRSIFLQDLKFKSVIGLLVLSSVISALSSYIINGQSIQLTIYQQRRLYYIMFYFILFYFAFKNKQIEMLLFFTAIVIGLFYIMQYFAYPTKLTEAKIFIDRGTIRINIPGVYFCYFGFFYGFVQFLKTNKPIFGIGAVLLFAAAFLSGFRSIILLYIGISLGYVLVSKRVKNKLFILIAATGIAISAFFVFSEIVEGMIKAGEKDKREGTENVRILAMDNYINKWDHKPLTVLFGNGEPNFSSAYGHKIEVMQNFFGYYLSDIGIFALFFKFGLFYVILVIYILIRFIFLKLPPELGYLRLYFIMQLFLQFVSYSSFEDGAGMLILATSFYLIDYYAINDSPNKALSKEISS